MYAEFFRKQRPPRLEILGPWQPRELYSSTEPSSIIPHVIFDPVVALDMARAGRQANTWSFEKGDPFLGSSITKVFCISENIRSDPQWSENGGREVVDRLVYLLQKYQVFLSALEVPVPEYQVFYRSFNGCNNLYYPTEFAVKVGDENLELEMKKRPSHQAEIIQEILEAAYPVITRKDIGIDMKPANWVRDTRSGSKSFGKIIYIDLMPVVLYDDESKSVYTEWPRIEDPQLQDFLALTHFSPIAIGYRFYQELCQMSPQYRSFYQETIRNIIAGWQDADKLNSQWKQYIEYALEPDTSCILKYILSQGQSIELGFDEIETRLLTYEADGFFPSYHLREMSLLLTEYMIKNTNYFRTPQKLVKLHKKMQEVLKESLDPKTVKKILKMNRADDPLHLHEVIRALSKPKSKGYIDEMTPVALKILKTVTKELKKEKE